MVEYEIVAKFYNACAGVGRPQTFFEEAELEDPGDYVRMKHGKELEKFSRETLHDDRILFCFEGGSVRYVYEFTPL